MADFKGRPFSKNLEKLILEFERFGEEKDFIGGAPSAADGDDGIGTEDGSAGSVIFGTGPPGAIGS